MIMIIIEVAVLSKRKTKRGGKIEKGVKRTNKKRKKNDDVGRFDVLM